MPNSSDPKVFIFSGCRLGRLTIGDLVGDVRSHELYASTPPSYLRQGRLREVVCDCGERRLISESILASGRLKSCGCLRHELRQRAQTLKIERLRKQAERMEVTMQIKIEQAKLRKLMSAPIHLRDEKSIDECAKNLRKLFARKAVLNRKISPRETYKQVVKPRMLEKLLTQSADFDDSEIEEIES